MARIEVSIWNNAYIQILNKENYDKHINDNQVYIIENELNISGFNKEIAGIKDFYSTVQILHPHSGGVLSPAEAIQKGMNGLVIENETIQKEQDFDELYKNDLSYKYIIFVNCKINSESPITPIIVADGTPINQFVFDKDCEINSVSINRKQTNDIISPEYSFYNCSINNLVVTNREVLILKNVNVGSFSSDVEKISMNNVKFDLFEHTSIRNTCDWGFENVKVIFNPERFKNIDKEQNSNFLNTFKYLNNTPGMFSQTESIVKYINYFSSRRDWFFRFIYWFNGGYTKWFVPLCTIIATICGKYWIIQNNVALFDPFRPTLVPMLYPIYMFQKVILNTMSNEISFTKVGLMLIELIYIYAGFSLLTFLKRKFGFRKSAVQ